MKIKTSELTGAALDWAVAECALPAHDSHTNTLMVTVGDDNGWRFNPSTDWAQGGAIIEREGISITAAGFPWWECDEGWYAHQGDSLYAHGSTPLIAAMRCYVASKLGAEVDVPDELMGVTQ